MNKKPTKRQQQILDFYREFHRKNSVPPTARDVMRRFRMKSPNGAWVNIRALLKKGLLVRLPGVPEGAARSIVAAAN